MPSVDIAYVDCCAHLCAGQLQLPTGAEEQRRPLRVAAFALFIVLAGRHVPYRSAHVPL